MAARPPLMTIYRQLRERYGPQHWWPGETPFEVMVGAILTQATSWANVEKGIANLKDAGALSAQALRQLPEAELARLIRPCLYYNVKARKLKALASFLGDRFQDDLGRMFAQDGPGLREDLLGVFGIGEETADSILLYAGRHPFFVIDAYTRRILERLGLGPEKDSYGGWQSLFISALPQDEALYNEYHALLVRHGKETCRKTPHCGVCCLREGCRSALGAASHRALPPPGS